jgi:hypothetical protein
MSSRVGRARLGLRKNQGDLFSQLYIEKKNYPKNYPFLPPKN